VTNTRRSAVALAIIAGAALSQTVVGVATAAEVPVLVEFTTTSSTIEYGQYWTFPVNSDTQFYWRMFQPGTYEVTSTGVPGSYAPILSLFDAGGHISGNLAAPYEIAPLGAGVYTFSVSGTGTDGTDNYTGQTPTPATLTVEKAKLGVELRVLADASTSEAAVVTAKFTGRFVDEYSSSYFPGAALSPAGTWKITITDSDGKLATERSVERAAGDDVLATSFYWADAEPGEQYTASASFVASGNSASNFAISPAQDFAYTAPDSARPVPTSSATAKPDASLPEATGFGLPLWVLILVIVLIVGLGVLVTILSVRLRRRPATNSGEVQS